MTAFERDRTRASSPAHELAIECLSAGIDAAHPRRAVANHCRVDGDTLRIKQAEYDLSAYGSIRVLGGGKAADDIAAAFETLLGDRIDGGVVVTDEPTAHPDRIEVLEGEHPTPGEGSVSGARAVLDAAAAVGSETLVIAAIAGGGSALLCAPMAGLSVEDMQAVTDALLESGASIDESNVIRRACSRIKGGGLTAAAAPATVAGVLVSDVVGNDLEVIASGPTVPVETDPEGALDVLDRYGIDVPAVREYLDSAEPTDPAGADVKNHVIAANRDAVDAARGVAREAGYNTCVLSTRIEGESAAAGRIHAAIGTEAHLSGDPVKPPAVILSGGETVVRVTGDGTGGPNQEFALSAAMGLPESAVLGSVDTDGGDGGTDAAGALVDGGTVEDVEAAREALDTNDSYPYLEARDGLLKTGATGTNVNDLRVLVIPAER